MDKVKKRKKNDVHWLRRILEYSGGIGIIFVIWMILFGVLDFIVMPMATSHGREVEIPDLFERDINTARQTASRAGFKIHETITERNDPQYPAKTIIEQYPAPFTMSKYGRKIRVVVSAGELLYPVPDIVGISEKEAEMKLLSQGFIIIEDSLTFVFSDYYPEGVVAEQSMPPGIEMRKGECISLTISLGVKPSHFIVPDLKTLNFREAKRALLKAGLSVGYIESIHFPLADSGVIVEQEPVPDVRVKEFGAVNLKISGGDEHELEALSTDSEYEEDIVR